MSSAGQGRPPRAQPPRTLADQLRSWSTQRLAALLALRPDLANPAPHDSSQVASRASTRSSILRALDGLNRLELSVLDALVVLSQTSQDQLVAMVNAAPEATSAAIERLTDLALVWESPSGLRALTPVAELLRGDQTLSRLRPVSPHGLSLAQAGERVATLSPATRALLEHLADSGGEGTSSTGSGGSGTASASSASSSSASAIQEALDLGLLVRQADSKQGLVVHLPGQVGIALRGGHTTAAPCDDLPEVATTARDQALVDRTAAGAAFEAVRRVELLLDHWGLAPPPVLRSGGLAVKDLKAAATELHLEPSQAAVLIEVAATAGLLAEGSDPDGVAAWLPTHAFDTWSGAEMGERWLTLVRAWLESPRLAGLVGARDGAGKTRNALAPELSSVFVVEARAMALAELTALAPGQCLAAGTGVPSVVARVDWLRPRRPSAQLEMVAWALAEAALLGVTGLDALAGHARSLLAGSPDDAAARLAPLLPAQVDHVLIQADLTAVAPGPLTPDLARKLHLLADVESRGGATVYRFTAASLRRGLDAGWSGSEISDFVADLSRTPVPQPLSYLLQDVVRTFGTLRVGHAESFLRADDEGALAELLHHPKAATLELRRLAPTVLVSSLPPDLLLPRLRALGATPVLEAADGTVRVARPDAQRARTPRARPARSVAAAQETARIQAVVTAIRAGDRAAAAAPVRTTATTPTAALALLAESIEAGATVLISYLDNHGRSSQRLVDPQRLEGGQLTGHDHRSDQTATFAVHRITSVSPVTAAP